MLGRNPEPWTLDPEPLDPEPSRVQKPQPQSHPTLSPQPSQSNNSETLQANPQPCTVVKNRAVFCLPGGTLYGVATLLFIIILL